VKKRACQYGIPCLDNYVQFVHFKRKSPSLSNSDLSASRISSSTLDWHFVVRLAALRPNAAAFDGRHSARSALRLWPTVSAHVDTGHVLDPVCSTHRPGLAILARIIYHRLKRSDRSGRGPTVEPGRHTQFSCF